MTSIQQRFVQRVIRTSPILANEENRAKRSELKTNLVKDAVLGIAAGMSSRGLGSAKILSFALGSLSIGACELPIFLGEQSQLNPIAKSANSLLSKAQFEKMLKQHGHYQNDAKSLNAALKAWEILNLAEKMFEPLKSDMLNMRRLLESGFVVLKVGDKPFETRGERTIATYSIKENTVFLRSNWTGDYANDQGTLIHELKHAIDDFLQYDSSDKVSSGAYEGGDFSTRIKDPFSGVELEIQSSERTRDPKRAVDFEVSAFITESQFYLSKSGLNPSDSSIIDGDGLTNLANILQGKGIFKTKDQEFDESFCQQTLKKLLYYFNAPVGYSGYDLGEEHHKIYRAEQNLSQMVESVYSRDTKQGKHFVNGSRSSLNVKSAGDLTFDFCIN